MSDARIPGFYRMTLGERIDELADRNFITESDALRLRCGEPLLNLQTADRMIENVVGVFGMPFAIATNFRINGRDYAVPMVVEEPSIVAGVSGAAKLLCQGDGIVAVTGDSLLIGQIQLAAVDDASDAMARLEAAKSGLLELANSMQPRLVKRGGGLRDIEFHRHKLDGGRELPVLHLLVDTRDAMGANLVNTLCEELAPEVSKIAGIDVELRILSNLADRSLVSASVTVPAAGLGVQGIDGEQVRDGIVAASEFANADAYRATTHNKGIMNGVDAVAIATGNDWRSVEAAAHAYAARSGGYRALSGWSVDEHGNLRGELCLPLKVGIVGGSLLSNPGAALGLRIAGAASAQELAEIMAATGLAQNFAALRALATSGIQQGHMRLHARSVAASIGAPPRHFDRIVDSLVDSGEIKDWKARELLSDLQKHAEPEAEDGTVVTAAGKIILLGEHAAVYGKHVLALPLPSAMTAVAVEADRNVRLVVPEWGYDETFDAANEAPAGAAAILKTIIDELDLEDRGCVIRVSAKIPPAAGLGSSAALAAVATRALDSLFGPGLDDDSINKIVFACERVIHGDPSGVDNTLAVFGRPILFRKGDPAEISALELKKLPPLIVGISNERGSTKEQVDKVRQAYEKNGNLYARVFDQIDRLSVAGVDALRKGDLEALGAMMNVCQGLLNGIQVSTPGLERMIDLARQSGALGAKLTGGGGGGAVIALCPGSEEQVAAAWQSAGYDVLTKERTNS